MIESLARVLSGVTSLQEAKAHDYAPIDRLHACAAAQRMETYGDGRIAAQRAFLAGLGVDLICLKVANVAKYHDPSRQKLARALMWKSEVLRIKEYQASRIAEQALSEFLVDFCPKCTGTGEIPGHEGVEGAQRMIQCPICEGHGIRRYSDRERALAMGDVRKLDKAFSLAHELLALSVREAMFSVRGWLR